MGITYITKEFEDKEILKVFNPVIKEWWTKKFKSFSPPQKFSIKLIDQQKNVLISSPTGSGKTLSAFTNILNELTTKNALNTLEDKVYCIYISPLKALGNDIEKNLNNPLQEITKIYEQKIKDKKNKVKIRIGVRTGDTTPSQKASMAKKPPHILITTPESFAIMLTTKKFSEHLSKAKYVIIDEIHSLADNKRGVHLSLSLERLQQQNPSLIRIGLSATVAPLEEVAKFLVGKKDENNYRNCTIIDVNYEKKSNLKVISPVPDLINTDYQEIKQKTLNIINEYIQKNTTTLIFTNTRSATERIVHSLKQKFPENYTKIDEEQNQSQELIAAHHGSLSFQQRLKTEQLLREGKLKAVVSSTSLELGIDIGSIDLVILLSSPKSVARALQRIGRAGHQLHEISQGRIIIQDRDDLIESSVLIKAAKENKIDKIKIIKNAYDVLSQQIYGIAIQQNTNIQELYQLIKKSYCFEDLTFEDYTQVLKYLSGAYATLQDRNVYAKIWIDQNMIGSKGKMARVLYMTNIGTIPDETNIRVKINKETIGTISEPFLEKLTKGDVFVLGGKTYEFRYSQGTTAFATATTKKQPTVPSWFSEMLPLSFDLSLEIQKFRRYMEEQLNANQNKNEILQFINNYLYLDQNSANSIYEYFKQQHQINQIPHDKKIVIEHYTQENKKYYIFHTLYGRRINDVLSRAIAFIITKTHKKDIELNIADNGFYIQVPKNTNIQITKTLNYLTSQNLPNIMNQALNNTEVLSRRFRHCAARSLMILRKYNGTTKSVSKQQLNSRLLISAIKKIDPNFIILKEAKREVLEDLMDFQNTQKILQQIETQQIQIKETYTEIPSPFSFNLISLGYTDIMKLDDKQEFLKRMHNYVLAKISLKK